MKRAVTSMGLKPKIAVFPGGTSLGVFGSLIIIVEALGRMRLFSVKIMERKEGLGPSPEGLKHFVVDQ